MIDKVFPRKLNSSKDARVRGKDEMIDAVNVTIDDNTIDFKRGGEAASGNFGVLKPVKGNIAVPNASVDFSGNGRVIGSCVDERNEEIYYFVYSSTASEQGVYKYSKSTNTVAPVLKSKYFNFSSVSFVESNLVYIPKGESEAQFKIRPVLFFTDDINEPRKIDLSRASEGQSLSSSNDVDFLDFVSVCPRTPIDPPSAQFGNDPTSSVSNFKGKKGFQFAYQNIYKSGDVSAISTYSKLQVPAAYIYQGTAPNASFFTENLIAVTIPAASLGAEVDRVRLLVREGNVGSWFVADEIEYTSGNVQFDFYNDKVLTILPEGETRRQFDSTPKKARAQEVTNNRLFFGNYVEGFDVESISELTSNGSPRINHMFLERPEDFITFNLTLEPEVRNVNAPSAADACLNRVAAYRLGVSQLPTEGVVAGTQVIFNMTLMPDDNFHMYESRAGYHGSARYDVLKADTGADVHALTQEQQMGPAFDASGKSFFGPSQQFSLQDGGRVRKNSVAFNPFLNDAENAEGHAQWRADFAGDATGVADNAGQKAVYGTNAGNPFIIQGKPIKFSGSFIALVDLSQDQLAQEITGMVVGNPNKADGLSFQDVDGVAEPVIQRISVISSVSTSSYNIDLQLNNLQKIKVNGSTDFRSKLVVAVGKQDNLAGNGGTYLAPMGYFIVNKAQPEFRLRDISQFYAVEDNTDPTGELYDEFRGSDAFFALDLLTLGDFETLTCIPDVFIPTTEEDVLGAGAPDFTANPGNIFDGWVCMTRDYIQFQVPNLTLADLQSRFTLCAQELFDIINGTFQFEITLGESLIVNPMTVLFHSTGDLFADTGNFELSSTAFPINAQQIRRWFGYLIPTGASVNLSTSVGTILETLNEIGAGNLQNIPNALIQIEGGRLINTFDDYARDTLLNEGVDIFDNDAKYFDYAFSLLDGEAGAGAVSTSNINGQNRSSVSYGTILAGVCSWANHGNADFLTFVTDLNNMPLISQTSNYVLGNDQLDSAGQNPAEDLLDEKHAHIEVFDFETIQISPQSDGGDQPYKSFKTKANHDFGIVFYDQRGRASDVMPLGSHYVPGYDVADLKGPVKIQISLDGVTIPPWAWHYQIVYAGNSTVDDFVQYSTGGAFVEFDSDDPDNNGNIYVSLNYLQNNSSVSYSSAFGAVNFDGSQDFYTFKEGDKLRILSYFTDNELANRQFPPAYEFDIVRTVTLADDEDNPLKNPDTEITQACVGQFLVLRNNPAAIGFSYSDVKQSIGSGAVPSESSQHRWNDRCVVEIYSPRKNQDAEDRVYYEVGKKFNILKNAETLEFESATIDLTEGDVYFRRIPMNMPRFLPEQSLFSNLIQNESSNPRFLDYFVETRTFTDTIIGANQQNWGKAKIVNRFQREIRRDSSITFSDVNNYSQPQLRYTRFDSTTSNFKDLPNSSGSIQRLINRGDSLFVLQEDQISDIPVSRTLLSDSAGTDIVVASEKVLGTQRFYSGGYGCSTNPESVTKIGESIYFANKENFEVYKFNPSNGVAIISEYGLKSYFRDLFSSALNVAGTVVKVVGGYDPILDEFVISVVNEAAIATASAEQFDQPTGTVIVTPTFPDAPDVTAEITDLNIDISLLEADLILANDTIADLQAQIAALYNQIASTINDPEVANTTDYQTIVDLLNEEIDIIEDEVISISNDAISGIESTASFHAQALLQANEAISSIDNFLAENALVGPRADNLADVDFTLPSQLSSDVMATTSHSAGETVTYAQFIGVVEAFKLKLREYKTASNDPTLGKYLTDAGTYTGRDAGGDNSITFEIGYGIPTDESLSDEFTDSNLPPNSALFSDPEFLNKLLGNPSTVGFGYLADVNRLFQSFAGGGIDGIAEVLINKEGELETLGQENEDLLNQIAVFVEAVYEGKGPEVETTPDAVSQTRGPFGDEYDPDGDGTVEASPLKAFYDAVQADDGDPSFPNLRAAITDSTLNYGSVLALIEDGLTGFSTPYQADIDSKFADITAIQAVRDSLATSFYNTSKFTFDVQRDISPSGQNPAYSGGVPSEFYGLLIAGGNPSPDEIISALGGDTIDQSEAQQTYYELFGSVSNILDFLSTTDFTEGGPPAIGGSGASDLLKEKIRDFLVQWDTQLTGVGFPTGFSEEYDFESLASPDTTDGALEAALDQALTAITGVNGGGFDISLSGLIGALQGMLIEYTDQLRNSGFFADSQFTESGSFVNAQNIFSSTLPIDGGPSYNELFNAASNISEAVTRLKEFQTILGSTTLVGQVGGTGSATGLPDLSIPTNSNEFRPAVGYTGAGGQGLIAQTVLQGGPIENQDASTDGQSIYTSYEGLRSLLQYIDNTLTTYSNAPIAQGGAIDLGGEDVFFNSFNTGPNPIDGSYPPFNFTGSLLDLIPNGSAAYSKVYDAIAALIGPISVDEGDIDLAQIVGIVNTAVNDSILYRTENIRTVLQNVEFEGGALGTADFRGRIDTSGGNSIPLEFKNSDLDDDNAVGANDLLLFLAEFGLQVDNQSLEQRVDDILNLLDEFNYSNVTIGGPGGNPTIPQTNTDFIQALIANINGLSNLLPEGSFFAFDNDPLLPVEEGQVEGAANPRYGQIYIDTTATL